jgi:hypothetical protein
MNPQCARCTQLLEDYIAAGNQLVDVRARFRSERRGSGSGSLARIKTGAADARRRVVAYQSRLSCCCANKLAASRAAATRTT